MAKLVPVNLMTYNVQGLSNLVLPIANLSARLEHIAKYLFKIVEKYAVDVLILQEVFSTALYDKIKESLRTMLSYDTGINSNRHKVNWFTASLRCMPCSLRLIPSGVIIFSKHEIKEKMRLLYHKVIYTDKFASKGAIMARIMIQGRLLDVVGTHLQSYEGKPAHKTRRSQMQQVAKWLTNKRIDYLDGRGRSWDVASIPLVFGGDLNSCIVQAEEMTKELFDIVKGHCQTIFGPEGPQPTYSTFLNDFCKFQFDDEEYSHVYDYLLVSRNAEVFVPQTVIMDEMDTPVVVHKCIMWFINGSNHEVKHASDHFPVFATIGI